MLKATIVVAFLMLAGVGARAAAPFDELFLRYEVQRSIYELAIAQLGQSRATRPEVRAYAATLVNDHQAYNYALRNLAGSKGVAMPSSMATDDKKRLDSLAETGSGAFDDAFLRETIRINSAEVRAFGKEASRTTDPEIHRFATRFLKVDEEHEAGARALSKRNVGSRPPLIWSLGTAMSVVLSSGFPSLFTAI